MNAHIAALLSRLDALLTSQLKMAEAHGIASLPNISVMSAKELLTDIKIAKAYSTKCN